MTADQQKQLKEGLLNLCNKIEQVHNFALEDKPVGFTNALLALTLHSRMISADIGLSNPPSKEERQREHIRYRHAAFKAIQDQGATALNVGYTRCLDCGKVEGMQRVGCSCFDMSRCHDSEYMKTRRFVEHGSFVIDSLKDDSGYECGDFISHKDLFEKIKAGERFFDFRSLDGFEITPDLFEKGGE